MRYLLVGTLNDGEAIGADVDSRSLGTRFIAKTQSGKEYRGEVAPGGTAHTVLAILVGRGHVRFRIVGKLR